MGFTDLIVFIAFALVLREFIRSRQKTDSDTGLRNPADIAKSVSANRSAQMTGTQYVNVDTGFVECLYCKKPIKKDATTCPYCKTNENAGMVRMLIAIFIFCYVIVVHQNKEYWDEYSVWIVIGGIASVVVISTLVKMFTQKREPGNFLKK